MSNDNKKSNNKSSSLAVGAAGVVAGAALGAAAAALSDKKTRKKVIDTVKTLKKHALVGVNKLKKNAEPLKEKALNRLSNGKKVAQKQATKTTKK